MAYSDTLQLRSQHILLVFLLTATVLLGRAAHLQLFDKTNQSRAEAISIDKKVVHPSRGLFFDRNKKLLVHNSPIYDLEVTVNRVNPQMDTLRFCKLLNIDKQTFITNITKDFAKDKRFSKNVPFIFLSKLSPKVLAKLQESLYEFPGFSVQMRNIRTFPQPIGANFFGYINEVTEKIIENEPDVYQPGDYQGANGLERFYEKELRGQKGIEYQLQDNLGRMVGKYKDGKLNVPAKSGKNLVLGIDADLQKLGEELMQGKRGSIVAIEPKSGEILSMVSAPTYDPNILSISSERGNNYMRLLNDPDKPLFDRSIMAKYPPGSIFKIIVGLIAMQEGAWEPTNGVACRGGYFMGGHRWGCHGHGATGDLAGAIQHSCNTYFFTTYRAAIDKFGYSEPQRGLDSFNNYVYKFGLGAKLGVDVIGERKGNVPTSKFFDRIYPKALGSWKSPTIMSIGIGQGELELTTLQMANLAAIIANRGWYKTPHFIKGFYQEDSLKIPDEFRKIHNSGIDPTLFEWAHEGMARVITGGTGRAAFFPGLDICGKTGTSQNPHGEDHSVFFAFAPRNDPKIAIAVFVENGGWGASFGAPISSLMIEQYLTGKITREPLKERLQNTRVGLQGKVKALPKAPSDNNPTPKPSPPDSPNPAPNNALQQAPRIQRK